MPRGRLVADWRVSANASVDLAAIDISQTVLVDAPQADTAGPPGTATLVEERPGRFVFETTAPAPQILVSAERFHAGWRVEVDDAPQSAPLRAYADYLACVVPPGTHRVVLIFDPPSFRNGLRLTMVGVALTAVLVVAGYRRSGDQAAPPGDRGDQETEL